MRNFLILIILFYILILIQISFLAHFNIFRILPNIILLLVILINVFQKTAQSFGWTSAIIGGFYLDIFSSGLFGTQIIILLLLATLIKIIKKYIRIPFFQGCYFYG